MCKCVYVFKWSVSGDIIQIQQRGFHSGRHISEGWDLDLGAKYHILILLDNQDLLKLFSVLNKTLTSSLLLHIYGCLRKHFYLSFISVCANGCMEVLQSN